MNKIRLYCLFLILVVFSFQLFAQTPAFFKYSSNTGDNHIIAIPKTVNPMYSNGTPLAEGDEIGVFTPGKVCAGAVVWRNMATTVVAWGDDQQTPQADGFKVQELFNFRIYQKSTKKTYYAVAEFSQPPNFYSPIGLPSIMKSLKATTLVSVDDGSVKPDNFELLQNYPNPFNPSTVIKFAIPAESNVSLIIYDLNGKEINRILNNEIKSSGNYGITWNGTNSTGKKVTSGVYFYRIYTNPVDLNSGFSGFSQVKVMHLVK